MSTTVCKRVIYSGRVQGVGFRYTTRQLAQGYPVTGHVRNLPDGTVEVVAEGPEEQVREFLAAVEARMEGYIESRAVTDAPPSGAADFRVRR
jgi:acylphosphatase